MRFTGHPETLGTNTRCTEVHTGGKMKRRRLSSLSAPFVLTVATGAAGPLGCGGDPEVSINPPPCPDEAPAHGDDCIGFSGAVCGYDFHDFCGNHPTVTATCESDGTWKVLHTSCNPPPETDD